MGLFGNDEEIKHIKEMIDIQKNITNILSKDILEIQKDLLDLAKNVAQHKDILMFMISQMSFNENAEKELKKLFEKYNLEID